MARQSVKPLDVSSQNDRVLFTVKDRSVITKALLHNAENLWTGTRKGYSVRFSYWRDWPADARVLWAVCFKRRWQDGRTSTIFDAMQTVESKVANQDLDAKTKRLKEEETCQ